MFLWRGINIRPSHIWLLPSSTVKYLPISIQTQGSASSFAVLVWKLCSFTTPSRGQEDVCTRDWCQQGKEKLFLWQQKNIHVLNTGCCPYSAIGWQIKGKYLCQDRTEVLTSLLKSTASGKGGRGLRWSESCGRTWQRNPTKQKYTEVLFGACRPKAFLYYDHLKEKWSFGSLSLLFPTVPNTLHLVLRTKYIKTDTLVPRRCPWATERQKHWVVHPLRHRDPEPQQILNPGPWSFGSRLIKAILFSHRTFPKPDVSFHLLSCSLASLSRSWPCLHSYHHLLSLATRCCGWLQSPVSFLCFLHSVLAAWLVMVGWLFCLLISALLMNIQAMEKQQSTFQTIGKTFFLLINISRLLQEPQSQSVSVHWNMILILLRNQNKTFLAKTFWLQKRGKQI